jgi:5'-nucleotidase
LCVLCGKVYFYSKLANIFASKFTQLNSFMLILITNDDGITAPGIKQLVEIASEYGEVVVVAPDSPQSGQGHAITLNDPLRLKHARIFEGIEAWECSGTPVDCVKLAKHHVLKGRKIDLCLSGINHGSNASINIIYSGTMSAAMEASIEGIPSIGFSLLDFSHDADFSHTGPWAKQIIDMMLQESTPTLLNVNFPRNTPEGIKGIKLCKQANGRWVETFHEGKDPMGKQYFWLAGEFVLLEAQPDADITALEAGYISVVPSAHDLTDYEAIKRLAGAAIFQA